MERARTAYSWSRRGAPGPPPVGGSGAVRASVHDDITNIAAIGAPNLHLLDRTTAELDDARNTGIGSLREITALGIRIQTAAR